MRRSTELRLGAALAALFFAVGAGSAELADGDPETVLAEADALIRGAEYDAALRLLEEAERAAARRGDRLWQARFAARRGGALANSGARDRARAAFERAAALLLSATDESFRAEGLRLRAEAKRLAADTVGALADYERSAAAYRALGDELEAATIDAALSVAAASEGRPDQALEVGRRALAVLEDAGKTPAAVVALSGVAYALHQLHRDPEALAAYDRLIRLAGEGNDQQTLLFAYCNRAEIRRRAGELGPAEEDLRRAVRGYESGRAGLLGTAAERASYLERQVAAYDRLILLLADSYRGLEAFEIAERFHARSFLEMLDRRSLARAVRGDQRLQRREEQILTGLGAARLALEQGGDAGEEGRREVDRLEAELAELQTLIRRRDPRYAGLSDPRPPTLEAVQAGLVPGEALVAYWVSAERLLAWAVTRDSARLIQLPVARGELAAAVGGYLEPLRSPRRAEDAALAGAEGEHLEAGRRLYHWLFASLPPTVREAATVVVVPDDALHYLPLESLPVACDPPSAGPGSETIHDRYRACEFLGLTKALAYAPSAGALLALRRRAGGDRAASPSRTLLALAPVAAGPPPAAESGGVYSLLAGLEPLDEAEGEARRVATLFPGSRLLLERQASESRFKAEAGDFRYLHLATHGLVIDDLPMTSGVLLASGAGEDGLLQAYEVLGLDLGAEVVTLSACRTGRGELSRGEGIVGLSRAFLYAGASSVLVSMWDVDDRSTALLMEAFYRRLTAGTSRSEALRASRAELFFRTSEARLVFRSRPLAYAHPRFWAPFVLIGEP